MSSTARFITIVTLVICHPNLSATDAEPKEIPVVNSKKKSVFRYFEVAATDIAQTRDGKLVAVSPINPRLIKDKKSGEWINENSKYFMRPPKKGERKLLPAKHVSHGPLPVPNWRQNDFDDSCWARVSGGGLTARHYWQKEDGFVQDYNAGEMMSKYRSLAMMCLRSRFTVNDPTKVSKLRIRLQFRGGVVLYLNGKEIGRAHMPTGEIKWDSLAEAYPQEVSLNKDGTLVPLYSIYMEFHRYIPPNVHGHRWAKDTPVKKRLRKLELVLAADAVRKGENVLAVEVHRSAAPEAMFTAAPYSRALWWNRVSLESLMVSAQAEAGSIDNNYAAPKEMIVSNHPVTQEVTYWKVPEFNTKLRPVRIQGVRNGVFSGKIVVNSPVKLSGFKLNSTELKGKGGAIPADRVHIYYQKFSPSLREGGGGKIGETRCQTIMGPFYNALEDSYDLASEGTGTPGRRQAKMTFLKVPVWFVIQVPKDAKPGMYKGSVSISAEKQNAVTIPLHVEVLGGWQLPESRNFRTFVAFDQSPETLALSYGVPLWSDAHWKLVEESLRLLGQLGNKEVLVTFTPKTFVGNEHAMLRFVKDKGGKLTADFSIVDRYLGLAAKHMGKIPSVCTIFNYGAGAMYAGMKKEEKPQYITVFDPKSKTLTDDKSLPQWGTPEALTFWKPVMEEYLGIIKKHKIGPNPVMYWTQFCGVNPKAWADLKKLTPGLLHMNRTHIGSERGRREIGKSRFYCAGVVRNAAAVLWDPDLDPPCYGWRHKMDHIVCPREGPYGLPGMRDMCYLAKFRQFPEACLLSGKGGQLGKRPEHHYRAGFGQFGADFWPVKLKKDSKAFNLTYRYSGEGSAGYMMKALLGQGAEKPCPTGRFQMLREGLQEAEARMFVTDALLDQPDKLGADLARRCKEICDRQTRLHRYFTWSMNYGHLAPQLHWKKTRELFLLAGEVQKALHGK